METNLNDVLKNYLVRIGDETNATLEAVKECFRLSQRQFDDQFKEMVFGKSERKVNIFTLNIKNKRPNLTLPFVLISMDLIVPSDQIQSNY